MTVKEYLTSVTLCFFLIVAGFIFGHGFASLNNSVLDFLTSNVAGWIQFLIGLIVSRYFFVQGSKAPNLLLRRQKLADQDIPAAIIQKDNGDFSVALQIKQIESIKSGGVGDVSVKLGPPSSDK